MIFVDYETASHYDLKRGGAWRYAGDPTTRVLITAYCRRRGSVHISRGEPPSAPVYVSWGEFDEYITRRFWPGDYAWVDAMAFARYLGLPSKLETCCKVLGFPAGKDTEGSRLISKYSKPHNGKLRPLVPGSEDSLLFRKYAKRDVVLLRKIWTEIEPYYDDWVREHGRDAEVCRRMNRRGVPVDLDLIESVAHRVEDAYRVMEEECVELCGLKPTQVQKLQSYLGLKSLAEKKLKAAMPEMPIVKRRVAEIRLAIASAAAKKIYTMRYAADPDGFVRGCIRDHGAHTGRQSSTVLQIQNMKRGEILDFDDDPEKIIGQVGNAIRGFIRAPDGQVIVNADYAQIECRSLAWLTHCSGLLDSFRAGRDVYKEMASDVYQVPVDQIDDKQRFLGKELVLGCGYGQGGFGFQDYLANKHQVHLPIKECFTAVNAFRAKYPEIVDYWYQVEDAALDAINHEGDEIRLDNVAFLYDGWVFRIRLPSGRHMSYVEPEMRWRKRKIRKLVDDKIVTEEIEGECITYLDGFGRRRDTYGGKLVENITQGFAFDVIAHGLRLVEIFGQGVNAAHHDEAWYVTDNPELDAFMRRLCITPQWAKDLPLKAEGWVGERYRK